MFLILTLIILVAAFNVISGLIMLVKDKSHDIAILRTMGATRGAIQRVFFMTGAAIGVAGTIAGFVLGVLFAVNIAHIQRWVEAADRHQRVPARDLLSDPASCRSRFFADRLGGRRWRWSCRSRPRSIPHGGRRGSIPSRP